MEVGMLVRSSLMILRAKSCDHVWVKLNDEEDQCQKCTVIATEAGKKNLERMRRS